MARIRIGKTRRSAYQDCEQPMLCASTTDEGTVVQILIEAADGQRVRLEFSPAEAHRHAVSLLSLDCVRARLPTVG